MHDLKARALRGGLARVGAVAAHFLARMGSIVVLARVLSPKDYGLVGMVAAFTGILSVLGDFGLSSAIIQRASVSEEQVSTLLWINLLFGALLSLITLAMAPAIASFYGEPRLFWRSDFFATRRDQNTQRFFNVKCVLRPWS